MRRMQQSQAAEAKRYAEANKRAEALEAQLAQLERVGIKRERYSQDPDAAFREAAHDYFARQVEEASMDPRELEFKRRDESLKQREARVAAETEQRQAAETARVVEQKTNDYATTIYKALETSNLPRNEQTVARMASLMLAAAKKGVAATPEQLSQVVARQVAQEQQYHVESLRGDPQALVSTFKTYLSGVTLDGAQIASFLGDQHTEALRKHLLAGAQSKFNGQPTSTPRPRSPQIGVPESKHPNGYHTLDEYNERQRARGRK